MQYESLSGPDFLDAVAQQEAANGLAINASAFRERSRQWLRDQQELDQLRAQAAEQQARLDHIAEHAASASRSGAITPTDTGPRSARN